MRRALALSLSFVISANAVAETTADPLRHLLRTVSLAPDESAAEETGDGDRKGLASLQADLRLLADGFESFRDEGQFRENVAPLSDRMSPEVRPFFATRASSLNAVYRTLAVADYTWAARFPEPSCAAVDRRRVILSAKDGLFAGADGKVSPWLDGLLGAASTGLSAEEALDRASSRTPADPAGRERLRARARRLTSALDSDKAVGSARAKLYCERASVYEELAVAAPAVPVPAVPSGVFAVVDGGRASAATLVSSKGSAALVGDASSIASDAPRLLARRTDGSILQLTASVVRRDSGLVLLRAEAAEAAALTPAENPAAKDDVVFAVGHPAASGPWTESSGLVTASEGDWFQTDASLSPEMAGGPVLDASGGLLGVLVMRDGERPAALSAAALSRWLDEGTLASAPTPASDDAGTAAVLTRASAASLTETGLGAWNIPNLPPAPPEPRGVCVAHCDVPSGGSSYSRSSPSSTDSNSGGAELGQAIGQAMAPVVQMMIFEGIPALFRGIGKLFSKKPSTQRPPPDNRSTTKSPEPKPEKKEPPLRPVSLALSVDRPVLAQGESIGATATVGFDGTKGSKAGVLVSFTVNPAGKLDCPSARTDASGIARTTCRAYEVAADRRFDALEDELRRRNGGKTPGRAKKSLAKGDGIAVVKDREDTAMESLDGEEGKHSDIPGIGKPLPEKEPFDLEIKGDRVTLTGVLGSLRDSAVLPITERPCPEGIVGRFVDGALKCGENIVGLTFHSESTPPPDGKPAETPPPSHEAKPPLKPTNLPPGAVPNPHRPGSWGELDAEGRFVERWRVDPGEPGAPGWGGKDHVHIDGGKEHLPPDTQYPEGKP